MVLASHDCKSGGAHEERCMLGASAVCGCSQHDVRQAGQPTHSDRREAASGASRRWPRRLSVDCFSLAVAAVGNCGSSQRAAGTDGGETRFAFDLFPIDWGLVEMSALQLIRTLNEPGDCKPVVAITGRTDVWTIVEAMQLGAATVLEIPLSPHTLHALVTRTIVRSLPSGPANRRPRNRATSVLYGSCLTDPLSLLNNDSRAPVERLAQCVVRVVGAERDPKTLTQWGRLIGASSPW